VRAWSAWFATAETRSSNCNVTHTIPIDASMTGKASKAKYFTLLYFKEM
jgi:hypothetical protein